MGFRLGSRIYTNSFATLNNRMAFPFRPNTYFGFQNKNQYAYNVYHQLADNGAGFGSQGARWARINKVSTHFIPPN